MSATFQSLLSNSLILKNLTEVLSFTQATPIQESAIPAILTGKDIYAGAKTGSGKTMAYLLPIFQRILDGEINRALVLAPTRELALQIDEEAMKLVEGQTAVVSIPLYGGVPIDPQILALKAHKPKLIIATPGRVLDLVQEGSLQLSDVQTVVLDEADRMCDMGFTPQVSQIMDLVIDRKQTLLFSATLPDELNNIMNRYCQDPVRIQIDSADQASDTIEHFVLMCTRRDKMKHVLKIISQPDVISVVFAKTRNKCDEVYDGLVNKVKDLAILHAGLPMQEREKTLRALKEGKIRTLISTDVFSRGIDIDDITHVIHYDLPQNLEDYIHRSGRSGRAGKSGTTVALVESDNPDQMRLINLISQKVKITSYDGKPLDLTVQQAPRGRQEFRRGRGSDRGREQDRDGKRPQRNRSEHSSHRHEKGSPKRHQSPSKNTSTRAPKAATEKKSTGLLSKTKSILKRVFGKK